MDLNQYQAQAGSFRLASATPRYVSVNLVSEVGEFFGHLAKHERDGGDTELLIINLKKELGDILWCLSQVCEDMGTNLSEIAALNIEKLTKRKTNNKIQGSGDSR